MFHASFFVALRWFMSDEQTSRSWQAELVARHSRLFGIATDGRTHPGCPTVGDGWRTLVETAVERTAAALSESPRLPFKIVQIKEKFATIRIHCRRLGHAAERSRFPADGDRSGRGAQRPALAERAEIAADRSTTAAITRRPAMRTEARHMTFTRRRTPDCIETVRAFGEGEPIADHASSDFREIA